MSDTDDDEGFEFEFSDEDEDIEEDQIDTENAYYSAKGVLSSDPRGALDAFTSVVAMQEQLGEWGFKSLKQIVKLNLRLGENEKMMERYREMLGYATRGDVTRNRAEKTINSVLDHVSAAQNSSRELLRVFYDETLEAFAAQKNERLWFKTSLKLGSLFFEARDYASLSEKLEALHAFCRTSDGSNDPNKGTQLLEVYALEIQMYTATKNNKKLKDLYTRCLAVNCAIPHPRIMGIIRECGGKMHIDEREFDDAHMDFFEAFKSYDECGSPRRILCLKYLILANMLMQSTIDPFESQETKPYKDHPEVLAMTRLVNAYQNNEITEFQRILAQSEATLMADSFIREHIQDLLRNVRTQVLVRLLMPYTRVKLDFLAKRLNIASREDVERLVVALILDAKINARIDHIEGTVVLENDQVAAERAKYDSLRVWSRQIMVAQDQAVTGIN